MDYHWLSPAQQDYADLLAEAARLRADAELDDGLSDEQSEENPTMSEYLRRRANHKRFLANNRDGGIGQ